MSFGTGSCKYKKMVSVLALLVSLSAGTALAQTPDVSSSMIDILFTDADDSGGASCGDTINYVITVDDGDSSFDNPTDVLWRLEVPPNAEVVPGSVVPGNPFEPATVISGNNPGDRVILVDFGELCGDPTTCGPTGASMNIKLRILEPNALSELSVQGEVSGSNFPTVLTDDLAISGSDNPTVTPYEPCPVETEPVISAIKTDFLATDRDGDGLADPGDVLRYQVTVRSTGTGIARALFYQASPGPHTRLIPGTVTTNRGVVLLGNSPGQTSLTVQVGDLATGQAATITYRVDILSPLPPGVDEVLCQGTFTGSNVPDELTDDPALPGAADPTVTPIDLDPVLEVGKELLPDSEPSPGGLLRWEITASNTGTGEASGVVVLELVPQETVFVGPESDPGWICPANPTGGSVCSLALGTLPPGATRTAVFTVRLGDPLPAGFAELRNCVAIAEGQAPSEVTETCVSLPVPGGQPDLAVEKTDLGASVAPDQVVVYMLTATNLGDRGASGVLLEETVPDNSSFEPGASEPGWVCTGGGSAGDSCTLDLGVLAGGGAARSAVFAVRVAAALPAGVTEITNTVTVGDDGANGADSDPTNNTATEETPLTGAMPDLEVDKILDPATEPRPGGLLRWSVTVANTGNQGAAGVELEEQVPSHTSFVSGESDPAWSCEGSSPGSLCSLGVGELAAGASVTAVFAVAIDPTLPPGVDFIENCAAIGPVEGCSLVPIPDAVPDLAITKDDAGVTVSPGDALAYQIDLSNQGTQGATGVVLTDRLPEGTALVPELSDPRWSCQPEEGGFLCELAAGMIPAGESRTVALTVGVDPGLDPQVELLTNVVAIADDGENGPDADPIDNEAIETTPVVPTPPPPEARLEVTLVDLLTADADSNGGASAGDTLTYIARVTNVSLTQAGGVSFTVTPDSLTQPAGSSVSTSQGIVVSGQSPLDTQIAVDLGNLAPGAGADVTFDVVLVSDIPPEATELRAQGLAAAANAPEEPSDDPDTPEEDDPTLTPLVQAAEPAEIPTASEAGLAVLVVLLAAGGMALVRRRGRSVLVERSLA